MRVRDLLTRATVAAGILLAVAGCGDDEQRAVAPTAPAETVPAAGAIDPITLEPLDPEAAEAACASTSARYGTVAEDEADLDRLAERAGARADFRVPRAAVARLPEGRLTLQLVARPFLELGADDGAAARRMAPGIRDAYRLYVADREILDGGFAQLWENAPSIAPVLTGAARRLGLARHAALFAQAEEIRRAEQDTAAIDERFAAFQEGCDRSLAVAVARAVRDRPRDFLAG